MSATLMKGKPVAEKIKHQALGFMSREGMGIQPRMVVLIAEEDQESESYLRSIEKQAGEWGCAVDRVVIPADGSTDDYLAAIDEANADANKHGILVMRPLPESIDDGAINSTIAPQKDLDGVTPHNMTALYLEKPHMVPATAAAVLALLDHYLVEMKGVRATVVGRSRTVGKPTAMLLISRHATVTICHSRTKFLGDILRQSNIIVVAAGVPGFITPDMIRQDATVVDAGFNVLPDGSICGDTDPQIAEVANRYAPVPGGVGPLTVSCILHNLVQAAIT